MSLVYRGDNLPIKAIHSKGETSEMFETIRELIQAEKCIFVSAWFN
jgi:hypothetical protein